MTALPRDRDGHELGDAADIAILLTSTGRTITPARVRDWARRSRIPGDRLYGMLPSVHIPGQRTGHTWYRLRDAGRVELATRRSADVR